MIDFSIYVYILVFVVGGIVFFFVKDYIKIKTLFYMENPNRRICKKCHVSQILCQEDGFWFWKKTAKSNCECGKFISYFLK